MAEIERRKEMRTLRKVVLVGVVLCVAVLVFPSIVKADEAGDAAQELIDSGVDESVMNELLTGSGDTLGQRAESMLKSDSITQRQYDKIYNNFVNMPQEKRQAIKSVYDKGYGEKIYDKLTDVAHDKLDDASVRDHIKDLKDEGYTKEQIVEMLGKEGVSVGHLKDLGYGQGGSKSEHAKDIRDMDTEKAQHKVDRAHEKYQDKKGPANRADHIKDKENLRGRAKDSRDVRKKNRRKNEAHEDRGTGAGAARAKARRGR